MQTLLEGPRTGCPASSVINPPPCIRTCVRPCTFLFHAVDAAAHVVCRNNYLVSHWFTDLSIQTSNHGDGTQVEMYLNLNNLFLNDHEPQNDKTIVIYHLWLSDSQSKQGAGITIKSRCTSLVYLIQTSSLPSYACTVQ